jgi:hypothetical protein
MAGSGPVTVRGQDSDFAQPAHGLGQGQQAGRLDAVIVGNEDMFFGSGHGSVGFLNQRVEKITEEIVLDSNWPNSGGMYLQLVNRPGHSSSPEIKYNQRTHRLFTG